MAISFDPVDTITNTPSATLGACRRKLICNPRLAVTHSMIGE
jgi:hypothetical protein